MDNKDKEINNIEKHIGKLNRLLAEAKSHPEKSFRDILADKELCDVLKKENPALISMMQGYIARSLLPFGIGRRIVMCIILLISVFCWIIYNNKLFLFLLLLLPMFSPRIMTACFYFWGFAEREINKGYHSEDKKQ